MKRKRLSAEQIVNKLRQAKVLIERWRQHYNTVRPHSAFGYRPPAPEATLPLGRSRVASLPGTGPTAAPKHPGGLT
jgi:hypothetical protein